MRPLTSSRPRPALRRPRRRHRRCRRPAAATAVSHRARPLPGWAARPARLLLLCGCPCAAPASPHPALRQLRPLACHQPHRPPAARSSRLSAARPLGPSSRPRLLPCASACLEHPHRVKPAPACPSAADTPLQQPRQCPSARHPAAGGCPRGVDSGQTGGCHGGTRDPWSGRLLAPAAGHGPRRCPRGAPLCRGHCPRQQCAAACWATAGDGPACRAAATPRGWWWQRQQQLATPRACGWPRSPPSEVRHPAAGRCPRHGPQPAAGRRGPRQALAVGAPGDGPAGRRRRLLCGPAHCWCWPPPRQRRRHRRGLRLWSTRAVMDWAHAALHPAPLVLHRHFGGSQTAPRLRPGALLLPLQGPQAAAPAAPAAARDGASGPPPPPPPPLHPRPPAAPHRCRRWRCHCRRPCARRSPAAAACYGARAAPRLRPPGRQPTAAPLLRGPPPLWATQQQQQRPAGGQLTLLQAPETRGAAQAGSLPCLGQPPQPGRPLLGLRRAPWTTNPAHCRLARPRGGWPAWAAQWVPLPAGRPGATRAFGDLPGPRPRKASKGKGNPLKGCGAIRACSHL